jgi:hypothetical protein
VDGRPRGDWELPEVFEGTINSGDLQQLKEITESADFRTITGTVGDPLTVRSHLLFGRGGLTPHSDVEILDASIAHYDAPQVFEVLDSGTRNTANSLKLFRRWFAAVTKSKQGKIDADMITQIPVRYYLASRTVRHGNRAQI